MNSNWKHSWYTLNLTVLLTINLFLIIAAVLAAVALVVWSASALGLLDWVSLLRPSAIMVIIYLIAILIGISMVVMIQQVILKPVRSMVEAMQRLAGGDFSVRMVCKGWMRPLEVREFAQAFNTAAQQLGSTELLSKDFIHNFSHEFKTPITSLEGFAELLLEDEEMPASERREYLSIIRSESHRLASLANSVLALSRVESQTILTDTAPFALDEQLRQCALLVDQKWAKKKRVALDVQIPDTGERYCGSEALLQEVWVNILDNAFKFSPDDGTIALTLNRQASGIAVTITDQGPGMDQATQARIFDQFYQGDTSHKTEGNGLGLAMAKKIVELHGGRITVDSRPGQGSAFTVWLPQPGQGDETAPKRKKST